MTPLNGRVDAQLRGKTVLITGASGGIGSVTARQFVAEGARVVLQYRTGRDRADALVKEFGPDSAVAVRADLTREAEVKRLFLRARQCFGPLDTLVANAGSWENRDVPLAEMSLRQWRETFDSVLTSAFLCAREFLRGVAERRRGNIVFVSSTAAVFGEAGHADYSAAKAAMAYGLVRTLKNEMGRLAPPTAEYGGGRINCVSPGWTRVPRTAAKLKDAATVRRVVSTRALPQVGRPEDLASAIVFLASDALARHITGQNLVVSGGMEGRMLWRPEEIDPALV